MNVFALFSKVEPILDSPALAFHVLQISTFSMQKCQMHPHFI